VFVVESPQLVIAFLKTGNMVTPHLNNLHPRKNGSEKSRAKVVVGWACTNLSTELLDFVFGDSLSSEKVDNL
jgi:hypothetical protein